MADHLDEALLAALHGLKRVAWVPVTERRDAPGSTSKFAGTPWLAGGESWPTCPRCRKPLALFLQLDLATLPCGPLGGLDDGLLQMFYCVSRDGCCVKGNDWFSPFAPHQLLRRIDRGVARPAASVPALDRSLPPATIFGWEPIDDYPNAYELGRLGFDLDDDTTDALFELGLTAAQRDKLLGWPAWVQNVHYPSCRLCGRTMELIFSLESQQNLFYGFGDSGSGQLMVCPDHPGVLGFAWQCL